MRMLERAAASAETASTVSSVEPSSTITISQKVHALFARYSWMRRIVSGSRACSLYAGTTMDIERIKGMGGRKPMIPDVRRVYFQRSCDNGAIALSRGFKL